LGYPWFAAVQPKINWQWGWLDHSQLPLIFRAVNAARAQFVSRVKNIPCTPPKRRNQVNATVFGYTADSRVPPQYAQFTKVFSEEESHKFPPSRPWDHAIDLKPRAPVTLPAKIYPLSQAEQEETRTTIKGHLERGTIRPSKGPYASSYFYIKKKDGKLRPVQDYRRLNEWMIQNRYPLPLIPELIDRLANCTLFTKFDIRWGYNNICIKDGDQWKAAFITNEGLFEPMVMFFGLTNSPATFQTMMNTIFREEMAQKWLTIYMDDMAIHTSKREKETDEEHLQWHRTYIKIVLQ
jgi:hypothetical protein